MTTPPLRLFFALPCPKDLSTLLHAWCEGIGADGHAVAAANLHMTLAFLGAVPRGRKAELLELGKSLPRQAFDLQLDHLGRWRNGILHLSPSGAPQPLFDLVQALRQALGDHQFEVERREFRPHLTLARHATRLPAAQPAFLWQVDRVALFSSENTPHGVHYRAIGNWPLKASE
ncbi:RNA 2',3'-cyclic phosphodiesterase [compost metagenome]